MPHPKEQSVFYTHTEPESEDEDEIAARLFSAHISGPGSSAPSSGSSSLSGGSRLSAFTVPPHLSSSSVYFSHDELYAAPDVLLNMLDTPWRALEWSKRKEMTDKLRKFQISIPDVDKIRILVHGPVGAGKSSFINSIDSIFQNRITSMAIAEAASGRSFTKTFQTHYIKDQNYGTSLPFALCDIMGLEDGRSEGVDTEDLIKALHGHISDGYKFNPASPCEERSLGYNRSPMLRDKIHCLVSVIPANVISIMEDAVIDKMKDVRAKAGQLRIPQVVVLTKVDETCPKVAEDIKRVYRSKKIKEKMQDCSNRLGVPMNCIFPVKCYHEEIQLNAEVDVLLLSALTFILDFANDHVAVMASSPNVNSNDREAAMAPPAANMRSSSPHHYVNVDDNQQQPPPIPPRLTRR